MNTEKIRQTFEEIARLASDQHAGELIARLGVLFTEQFSATRDERRNFENTVKELRSEFVELSTLVSARLQNNETHYAEQIERLIDRVHTLANRFMAVEDKTNQTQEYFELRFDELVEILKARTNTHVRSQETIDRTA